MSSTQLNSLIDESREALGGFLSTLLNAEAPLSTGEPSELTPAGVDESLRAERLLLQADPFVVLLDQGWVALLSEAMLGEPMAIGEEGADDLIGELASQGYGAIRNHLAGQEMRLPEASFQVHAPGSDLPDLAAELLAVSFQLEREESEPLTGTALFPAPEIAAESAAEPAAEPAAAPSPAPQQAAPDQPQTQPGEPVDVARAAFADLGQEQLGGNGANGFDLLAEVELEVTVELGRRRLPLADVLRLTTGSVIELEKLVGEPLDVYANGRLIAEGEAVVIDEQFGVRITNLASKKRRNKAFF